MKTKLFFLLTVLLFASGIQAQPLLWNTWQQYPSGTTSDLNFMIENSAKYWAVGDNGTIISTTNSGSSWILQNVGVQNSLKGIHIQNSAVFSICGSNGVIAKTTNSGVNFTNQSVQTTNGLNSIAMFSTAYGLVAGENGAVYQTANSGANWSSVSIGVSTNLNSISIYDGIKGFITGANGVIFKSNLEVPSLTFSFRRINTGTALNLRQAVLLDSNNIWIAASAGKILHTTNAGVNWQIVSTGFSNDLYSISMPSANEIYAVGSGGLVIKSTNGGATFSQMTSNTTSDLKGIIIKNNIGTAIGNAGVTLKNILGGNGGAIGVKNQKQLNANNISTWVWNSGVFNADLRTNNTPGMEWPKGTGKFAIFTTGLCLAGYVNGELRMANALYEGEYTSGYIENGIAKTNTDFQIFRVAPGDNCYNSVDYANWQTMVSYGAPYNDVNGNGQYDACIDIPGVKNAEQTVFVCLTDGFPQTHTVSEFSGGTAPMNAEVHLTSWAYQDSLSGTNLSDVQFFKWEIINKNNTAWNGFYSSILCDPDLGEALDDYSGCDSTRNLGYCYNGTPIDGTGSGRSYGANPPAVGMRMLKFPINKIGNIRDTLNMTSFCNPGRAATGTPVCEGETNGTLSAYNYMHGLKKDGTPWLNPTTTPAYITKYCYTGDPETGTGWTEYTGKINNCGGVTTGNVETSPPGDRKFLMSFGKDNFNVNPGDTQTVVMAQMIARGSNNKNSVTKLKQLSDNVYNAFKNGNIPIGINYNPSVVVNSFMLFQNYPNPFNPATKIKFQIPENTFASLKIYDVSGKEINTVINENLLRGEYEYQWNAANYPSGVYFYRLETESYTQTRKMILVK